MPENLGKIMCFKNMGFLKFSKSIFNSSCFYEEFEYNSYWVEYNYYLEVLRINDKYKLKAPLLYVDSLLWINMEISRLI